MAMQWSLFRKVWVSGVATLMLGVLASLLVLGWSFRAQQLAAKVVAGNLEQASAISAMRLAALEQSALLPLYVLDPGIVSLPRLEAQEALFSQRLAQARMLEWEEDQKTILDRLVAGVEQYRQRRAELTSLLAGGRYPEARRLFERDLATCAQRLQRLGEALEQANNRDIETATHARQAQTRRVLFWVGVSLLFSALFIGGLLWFFFRSMMQPLARMASEASRHADPREGPVVRDEIGAVGQYIRSLKEDAQQVRSTLEETHDHLVDAEKLAALGRLAAGVAHEIRSPLTALKLRLYSMQKALGGHARHAAELQVMSDEIARLDRIIRNFLEFSRPPEIRAGRHDLVLLLQKTVELLKYRCESCGIRIEIDTDDEVPDGIVDEQQVRQVFLNLLNNAIDAQPAGGVIQLRVGACRTEAGRVMVRVSDQGRGIPPELQPRIFDPFCSGKKDGAGLGLWIARRIVMEHNGRMELERSDERGTVFVVALPAAMEAAV